MEGLDSKRERFNEEIRKQTVKKYGLAKICERCSSTKYVDHHHSTEPYHTDIFIDLCLYCHQTFHRLGVSVRRLPVSDFIDDCNQWESR